MKRLKVWFDLDGVLVDSVGLVERQISNEFGFPFRHYHYYPSPMNIPDEAKKRITELYRDVRFISSAPAFPEAPHVVRILQEYFDVGILTCRPCNEVGYAHTHVQCLGNFGIEPTQVATSTDKPYHLSKARVDYYIEDSIDNANQIASAGIFCFLLEKLYNQGETERLVCRCPSLLHFLEGMLMIQRRHECRVA